MHEVLVVPPWQATPRPGPGSLDGGKAGRHVGAMSGTEGYASEAEALIKQYESISFDQVHREVLHLLPRAPCRVVDIGAGTGRDAAGFAALGHAVLAVEPTAALRARAMEIHPSPLIEW